MKKNIFLGIIASMILSGCSGEFLDKQPSDKLSDEVFWKTAEDFNMALTACYAELQNHELYTWSVPYSECMTDNGYNYMQKLSSNTLSQGPITPTTDGVGRIYTAEYANIARYNNFLKKLLEYAGGEITESDRIHMEAEVRLLRAISYLDLYCYYGSVPLVLEPLTYETQDQPRAEASAIYNQILTDVDFAIGNLKDVAYKNGGGHFVKNSAQVIKARALMYEAYDDNGVAKSDVMSQVKQITNEIINSGSYSIAPTYRGLFCNDLGEQKNNPEYIFAVNYLGPNNNATSFFDWGVFNNYIGTADAGGGIDPLMNLVAEYEFVDGSDFSESNPLYNPGNTYENRDPRMAKTMCTDVCTFEGGFTHKPAGASFTGYYFWKIISEDDAKDPRSNNWSSNWPLMRYAEVLLMYAEAANEVDGPTEMVQSALNQIRARGDIQMPPVPTNLTKEQMRDKIRRERRIELAFEGFRYNDLKRWKIAEKRLNMSAEEAIIPRTFEKRNYRFPIPQSEIDKSRGVLIQNPDYK